MEFDDLSESGIQRIADFSPYLGQLADVAEHVGARQREDLIPSSAVCMNNGVSAKTRS